MSATLVDALLAQDAIVFGSLPPAGRDLDLLVSPAELTRLATALEADGWLRRGRTWVRFGDGTAYAVDLRVLEDWAPTAEAARGMAAQAEPIEGYVHLRAPAAHHRLLVLARRHAEGMRLDERRRTQLAGFSAADRDAARSEAPEWGLADALAGLARAEGLGVEQGAPTRPPWQSRRGSVISLSGLDGAGKSTHGELLRAALEALGYDVTVEWSKIARDPALLRLGGPVKRALLRVVRSAPPPAAVELEDEAGERRNHPDGPPPPVDGAKQLRERSALLTWAWTLLVAWTNGRTHRRIAAVPRGRVVICDRYVLDSLAHLRYRYGVERRFRVQSLLIRLMSPRPTCAVFLDVSPTTARARKPEQYTTADLTRLQQVYREEAARLDVVTVDPARPLEEVAAEVARSAWERLSAERRGLRRLRS